MNKLNNILLILGISLCSIAAFICAFSGSPILAGINLFFLLINGHTIYNKLSLLDEGE